MVLLLDLLFWVTKVRICLVYNPPLFSTSCILFVVVKLTCKVVINGTLYSMVKILNVNWNLCHFTILVCVLFVILIIAFIT